MAEASSLRDRLFGALSREPEGRPMNLIWFGGAALMLGLFLYYPIVHGASPTPFTLLFVVMFALGGVAESAPADRPRLVAGLRAVMIVYASTLAALSLGALVGGPDILF